MPRTREPRTPPFPIRLTYADKARLRDLGFTYSRRGWRIGVTPTNSRNLSLAVARALELAGPHIDAYVAKIRAEYDWLVGKHRRREEYLRSPEAENRRRARERRAARAFEEQQRIEREKAWRTK